MGRDEQTIEHRKSAPWWVRGLLSLRHRLRWYLLPYTVAALARVAGWLAAVAYELLGMRWVLASYGAGLVVAAAWVLSLRGRYDRALATLAVVAGVLFSVVVAVWPLTLETYLAGFLVTTVLGVLWWFRGRCRAYVERDRVRERFARGKLGAAGARVVDVEHTAAGTSYRVDRGDASWPDVTSAVADTLDVPTGSVLGGPDKWGNKKGVVRVLNRDVFDAPEVAHPALAAGATEPGGEWAPGARSIYDPAPIGDTPEGDVLALPLMTRQGAARILLAGKSGGGKSNSFSVLTAHVAACYDADMIASDVVKGGGTFEPWRAALGGPAGVPALALTGEDTAEQMRWLLAEVNRRCREAALSGAAVYPGRKLVYGVEEAAELFTRFPELSDDAVGLARLVRQAGVVLLLATQGTDYDSVPVRLRENLHGMILHKMEAAALRRVWKDGAANLDMELFEQPGMLYAKYDGDGLRADQATPVRSYALYEPDDMARLAAVYARHGGGQAGTSATVPAPRVEQTEQTDRAASRARAERAGEQAAALLLNPPDMPAGPLPILPNPEPMRYDRDTHDRALSVIREAGERGARAADVARVLGVSRATAGRIVAELRDLGEVLAVGQGPASRWRAVDDTPAELAGVCSG